MWPHIRVFNIKLRLDLDVRALIIVLRMNLELGPRFTEVWYPARHKSLFFWHKSQFGLLLTSKCIDLETLNRHKIVFLERMITLKMPILWKFAVFLGWKIKLKKIFRRPINPLSGGLVYKAHKCHQFLSILYWRNSEYWSQKHNQSGNIHSTELDVYAVKQRAQKLSFIFIQTQAR